MGLWTLFIISLPLILYVLIEWKFGLKAGVITAVVFGVLECLLTYFYLGIWDPSLMVTILILVGLGSLSLVLKKPIYFLLNPALMSIGMGAILAYFQYFDTPLILKYLDRIKMLPEVANNPALNSPQMIDLMVKIFEDMIYVCFLHGLIMIPVAFKANRLVWILVSIPGFFAIAFVAILARTIMSAGALG